MAGCIFMAHRQHRSYISMKVKERLNTARACKDLPGCVDRCIIFMVRSKVEECVSAPILIFGCHSEFLERLYQVFSFYRFRNG